MSSAAYAGLGSSIAINTGTTGAPVWTAIAELSDISLSGRQASTVNVTNFSSTAIEFLPVLPESGSWAIKGSYVNDPGRLALEASFSAKTLKQFKITLPLSTLESTVGDTFTFLALVNSVDYTIGVQAAVTFTSSLKISGPITITPGD